MLGEQRGGRLVLTHAVVIEVCGARKTELVMNAMPLAAATHSLTVTHNLYRVPDKSE